MFLFLSIFTMWLFAQPTVTSWETQRIKLYAKHLEREVELTLIVPFKGNKPLKKLPVLLSNDGQDFAKMSLPAMLSRLHKAGKVQPFMIVGIHCNENRMNEYGTASQPDYKNRGNKAAAHTQFVLEELLPYLRATYKTPKTPKSTFYMGFSLGGLSAMDIVWHNPAHFSKVGAFSPSFWWRKKAYEENYDEDADRIMHQLVRQGEHKKDMKFWFQAGTEDETEDRNNNGIIDAIDDIVDMMQELEKKGYTRYVDFVYDEIKGGTHDVATWERALPPFFEWLFKK